MLLLPPSAPSRSHGMAFFLGGLFVLWGGGFRGGCGHGAGGNKVRWMQDGIEASLVKPSCQHFCLAWQFAGERDELGGGAALNYFILLIKPDGPR